MYPFGHSVLIDRSPQEVFDFVTDPANDGQWQSSSEGAEWTSEGPVGVGSTQRSVNRFLGRKIEGKAEVTVWDPPNEFALKSVGGPFPFELTLKLVPKEGGTLLTIDGRAEFGGFLKLGEGLVGKQLEKQIETDFNARFHRIAMRTWRPFRSLTHSSWQTMTIES